MIKFARSGQAGAPVLSGTVGSLIEVLDAVLIDGFGDTVIDSITSNGVVATATISAGHAFETGDKVLVSGSTVEAYNGHFMIYDCATYEFKYDLLSAPIAPAAGTLKCEIPAFGWTHEITAENKAVYCPSDSDNFKLRVIDDGDFTILPTKAPPYYAAQPTVYGASLAKVDIFESMLDIDVGLPSSILRAQYVVKSHWQDSVPKTWYIVGTSEQFYLFIDGFDEQIFPTYFFGKFASIDTNDIYNYLAMADAATYTEFTPEFVRYQTWTTSPARYATNVLRYQWGLAAAPDNDEKAAGEILRGYTSATYHVGAILTNGGAGSIGNDWSFDIEPPNLCDGSTYYLPLFIMEKEALRGIMPGVYHSIQNPVLQQETRTRFGDTIEIDGTERKLMTWGRESFNSVTLDMTGPWG